MGKLNMLFCYLDINCHTGVMLCSPSVYNEYNSKTKEVFKKIEEKFNSSVTVIRDIFNESCQVFIFNIHNINVYLYIFILY